MNGHPARPIAGEAFVGRDRERLHAFGVAWPSWHVHFRGADRRCHAAMHVAFEIANSPLARRINVM